MKLIDTGIVTQKDIDLARKNFPHWFNGLFFRTLTTEERAKEIKKMAKEVRKKRRRK